MSKHRRKDKSQSNENFNDTQRYGPIYNNPFGINPQQLLSMLGGNMNMGGLSNIISSMNREGVNFNTNNPMEFSNKEEENEFDYGKREKNQSYKEENKDNFIDINDENVEMMLSLKKIVDPKRYGFIDKIIELYEKGLFK